MDTKPFTDLQPDPRNPRTMSDHVGTHLNKSMDKFGDLGGIVFNIRNGLLVGGHQRIETIKNMSGEKKIVYMTKYDQPDHQGTVALGYVWNNNTPYAYREVDWSEAWHLEANVAANRLTGEFDLEILAEVNQTILEEGGDLDITGQTQEEIDALLHATGPEPENPNPTVDDGLRPLMVKLTDEQLATIYEAIGVVKRRQTLTDEPNRDLDGAALYYVCQDFLGSQNVLQEPVA